MGNGDIPLYGGPSDCFIKICLNTHKKDRVSFGTGKDYCLLQSEGSTKSRMQHAPLPPRYRLSDQVRIFSYPS